MKKTFNFIMGIILCVSLCSLLAMSAYAATGDLIVTKDTTIADQTISGNIYVPRGYTLTLSGTVNVKGNVYVWGTLINRSALTINNTLYCLHYNGIMSAGEYDSGYFYNYSQMNANSVIVTGSWISTPIPGVTNTATVPPTPTPTPKPTPSPTSGSSSSLSWNYSNGTLTISGTGDIDDYSFYGQPWETVRNTATSIVIEEGITRIGQCAFYEFSNVNSVAIPKTVSSIGTWAFSDCSKLDNVIIPNGVTKIENWAFGDCPALKTVTLPKSTTEFLGNIFLNSTNVIVNIHYSNTSAINHCNYNGIKYITSCNEQHTVCDTTVTDLIDSTCSNEGEYTEINVCLICGEELGQETKIIAKKEHKSVTDKAVNPTCTSTGLTEGNHCSVCKEVLLVQEIVPALGHTEVTDDSIDPTCINTGLTKGQHCSICNEILLAQQVVDALGHNEVIDAAFPATYISTGLTEGKHCARCNQVFIAQKITPRVKKPISINLPISLKTISEQAFMDSTFECVIVPKNCIRIGACAFESNESLQFVEIPASVKQIDATAFKDCNKDLVIITTKGSAAETYAAEHSIFCVIK